MLFSLCQEKNEKKILERSFLTFWGPDYTNALLGLQARCGERMPSIPRFESLGFSGMLYEFPWITAPIFSNQLFWERPCLNFSSKKSSRLNR
jgi:hypothetical protein